VRLLATERPTKLAIRSGSRYAGSNTLAAALSRDRSQRCSPTGIRIPASASTSWRPFRCTWSG